MPIRMFLKDQCVFFVDCKPKQAQTHANNKITAPNVLMLVQYTEYKKTLMLQASTDAMAHHPGYCELRPAAW